MKGPLIVARDMAHAKIKEKLDRGEAMPEYFKITPFITQDQLRNQTVCIG